MQKNKDEILSFRKEYYGWMKVFGPKFEVLSCEGNSLIRLILQAIHFEKH